MAAPFRLKTALADDLLRVHACASREALSDLGESTLTLLSERKDIRAAELLGKPATLTMALRDDAPATSPATSPASRRLASRASTPSTR